MSQVVEAIYDGQVLRPDSDLAIAPNTRVRVTVEVLHTEPGEADSFLDVAASLNFEGPPDWARNLDKYLYGRPDQPRG